MKLSLLSLSLLLAMPAFSAEQGGEIQKLQKAIVANKQSIENFLDSKAHSISAEKIARLEAERNLGIFEDVSERSTLGNMIFKSINEAYYVGNYKGNAFDGSGAMASLLSPLTTYPSEVAPAKNAPKVYTLTVLNPENQQFLKKLNEDYQKLMENEQKDAFVSLMANYVDNSISAKRYATYAEAEKLANNISKLNSDLRTLEEKVVDASEKQQKNIEKFTEKMDEWLNKKIIFMTVNQKGINVEMIQDRRVVVDNDMLRNIGLNRNFSQSGIAQAVKTYYRNKTLERNNRGSIKISVNNNGDVQKYVFKTEDTIEVAVSVDRSSAVVTIPGVSFRVSLIYQNANKLKVSVTNKLIYENYSNFEAMNSIRNTQVAKEVMLKAFNKNLGYDWFNNVGTNSFSIK